MSKTRTFEFDLSIRTKVVVQQEYIDAERERLKGTEHERISAENPDDEAFCEVILRMALRSFARDALAQGIERTEGLRGTVAPAKARRTDKFRAPKDRTAPQGAAALATETVHDAIPL